MVCAAPAQATFPGPNGVIAYANSAATFAATPADIYRVDSDGSLNAPIVASAADEREPAWSPDRRTIAFVEDIGGNKDIYTARFDGTDVRRMTTDGAPDVSPAWSPDGQRFEVYDGTPGEELFAVPGLFVP